MNESGFQNPYLCYLLFYSFSRYVPPLPISIFINIKEFSTQLVLPSSITRRLSPEKPLVFFPPLFSMVAGAIFPIKPLPPFAVHHISSGFSSLFLTSAAWLPCLLQLVPRMERGPPHTSRVLPAPLMI